MGANLGDKVQVPAEIKDTSKSEYVIYKLKEMGKITEKDVMLICKQFERLDSGNCGRITLGDLMEHHH
ncbi:hypothetical protein KY290_014317 [Solanum tuberosum]|uniref:Uncharacterized protein n=1 Tax=Solanum tuberosum TaxID=4113 RepID=A0ABQ7VPA0_SOLTU|nr:hypothetical protein KY289_014377 [Solanum tuberosum]KAH0699503.1 hypothetical protein KY284_013718 [Solanum tuberosum]KAH0717727.1 hypothetical protein KY285_013758 [Solanum tuberosum]KAH0770336.1 hypothetical protein KY290_014317 [Solanum tuberosum]